MAKEMRMNLILTTSLLFSNVLYSTAHYQTTYIEDLCTIDEVHVWNLGSASSNSSGILKASKNGRFLKGLNCTILIQPPLGFGVTLSVRHLDFRPHYPPNCLSYIKIYENSKTVTLCGYSDDASEYQSYNMDGQAMKLEFNTVNTSEAEHYSDFTFIATSYLILHYNCEMKMFQCKNSRCIWNGLKCDGHNNCGDQSDEYSHGSARCGMMSPGLIAGTVVGSVMAFLLIILVPFACCRWRSKVRNQARQGTVIQPNLNYGTDGRTSIQEADPQPGASTSLPRYHDLPPAYKP